MNVEIIGKSLAEYTLNSKTSFLEGKDNNELEDLAKKKGIQIPNRDLSFFKTIYAEVNVPNRNKMVLPLEKVKKGLPSLIGKQINFDHKGTHFICGFILDAKLEDKFIIVYGCLFKSSFKDDFETVKEKFEGGDLFVSFEISAYDEKGELVLTEEEGNYIINKINFCGCGLLLKSKPACAKAKVLDLLASEKIIKEAEEIIKVVFDEDLSPDVVYAELYMNEEEEKIKMADEKVINQEEVKAEEKKEETQAIEEPKVEAKAKCSECGEELAEGEKDLCAKCKKKKEEEKEKVKAEEPKAEEKKEEVQATEAPKVEEKKEEPKAEEVKAEEKKEEPKVEAQTVVITTEESVKKVDTIEDGKETVETKGEVVRTVESETGKSTETQKIDTVVTYTFEQYQALEAEKNSVKAELETVKAENAKIKEELETLKASQVKTAEVKPEEKKADLVATVKGKENTEAKPSDAVNHYANEIWKQERK